MCYYAVLFIVIVICSYLLLLIFVRILWILVQFFLDSVSSQTLANEMFPILQHLGVHLHRDSLLLAKLSRLLKDALKVCSHICICYLSLFFQYLIFFVVICHSLL